jgi:hypothetical protein
MRLETGPREVIGYHGCTREVAQRLIDGESWLPSQNRYDWLGEGVYFWEYAPYRALEWAEERYSVEAAVIRARIRLGDCLNLLDRRHLQAIQSLHMEAVEIWNDERLPIPVNKSSGAHFLDRHIVDLYCLRVSRQEPGLAFQTVRGCFPEGEPIYPGSKILSKTHVQIAVRDASSIKSISLVKSL